MKKLINLFVYGFLFLVIFPWVAGAQVSAEDAAWKQELKTDRQQIKEEVGQSIENAQEAKTEENQLKAKIKAALDSGDMVSVKQLRDQLMAMHQDNLEEKIDDQKDVQADIQELKSDIKDARQEGHLPVRLDRDNNPPGPKGGPGTNWENPPGPRGGKGASPDRR